MEKKIVITFNDLPEVVAQLRDEVMSLRSLLTEQRSVNNARRWTPMSPCPWMKRRNISVFPKGNALHETVGRKQSRHKPGKRYCLYRDELDNGWNPPEKNPVPLSDEELNKSLDPSSHRRKPNPRNW